MNKKRIILSWAAIIFLALSNCGCVVIGAAISAGISYGIYQATK